MVISVSFPFFWVAQPGTWGPASLGAGFLHRILSPTRLIHKTPQSGVPRAPSAGCCFLYSIISPLLWSPNSLNFLCAELYNSSTPTQYLPITGHRNMHIRRIWNGMFDRHRAEITVMQFTGLTHPVLQFLTVPWDFNPVPYCQPSSPTPTEYKTCALFGMTCLAGLEVNILQEKGGSKESRRSALTARHDDDDDD